MDGWLIVAGALRLIAGLGALGLGVVMALALYRRWFAWVSRGARLESVTAVRRPVPHWDSSKRGHQPRTTVGVDPPIGIARNTAAAGARRPVVRADSGRKGHQPDTSPGPLPPRPTPPPVPLRTTASDVEAAVRAEIAYRDREGIAELQAPSLESLRLRLLDEATDVSVVLRSVVDRGGSCANDRAVFEAALAVAATAQVIATRAAGETGPAVWSL